MKAGSRERVSVLHVVDSLAAGGMENGIVNVARLVSDRGFEVHAACLSRRGQFADRMPQPAFVSCLGKKSGFSAAAALRLAALVRRLRPDVIHTHNLGPLIYTALATFGGRTHPILHGEHSMLAPVEKAPRRLNQRRSFYRACQAVHTVSAGMLRELQHFDLNARRMLAILNGVDTGRFAPGCRNSAREAFGIPNDAHVIGIVARFGQHKGHRLLLQAFERLAQSRPGLHLLMAGSGGPEEEPVRAAVAESAYRTRIHLTGFVAAPEHCYRALDLLVIPSTNEGLSNVALEAMACGVPVLGNPGCGHGEIIDHDINGWITDLRSTDALAAAIGDRLADSEHMIHCGRRARLKIEADFNLSKMADAYEDLYRETSHATPV